MGPGRAVPDRRGQHVGAQPGDGVGRGLVLRAGGREHHEGRDAGGPIDVRRRDGCDARIRRDRPDESVQHSRITGGVRGDDEGTVGARAEPLGDEVVGPALGTAVGQ